MKVLQLITLASLTIFFSFSCESSAIKEKSTVDTIIEKTETAKNIDAKKFQDLLSSNSIVLDVRRPIEFNAGHIENAVNVNYFDDDFIQQINKLDKSKTLLIYCASGGRSSGAMSKLKGNGFTTMFNLLGGISAWKNAGFKVVK
ncbi:rhodanese-like domain-containing protein [Flavobacteriales bacterium]|jgi:phage shock protein E|nr:rhodanese-like domain-containing protein [Flavobacteriales bacterium]